MYARLSWWKAKPTISRKCLLTGRASDGYLTKCWSLNRCVYECVRIKMFVYLTPPEPWPPTDQGHITGLPPLSLWLAVGCSHWIPPQLGYTTSPPLDWISLWARESSQSSRAKVTSSDSHSEVWYSPGAEVEYLILSELQEGTSFQCSNSTHWLLTCSFFMTHRVPKITFFRMCSFLWLTRGLNWPIEIQLQHMRKRGYKTEKVLIFRDRQTDTFLLYIEIRIATLVLTVMKGRLKRQELAQVYQGHWGQFG